MVGFKKSSTWYVLKMFMVLAQRSKETQFNDIKPEVSPQGPAKFRTTFGQSSFKIKALPDFKQFICKVNNGFNPIKSVNI